MDRRTEELIKGATIVGQKGFLSITSQDKDKDKSTNNADRKAPNEMQIAEIEQKSLAKQKFLTQ